MTGHSAWLTRLARLRIVTASNAPHKPLLLLVVLDLAQEGELGPELLPLTPQLAFRFCSFWKIVAHRRKQKPDVRFKQWSGVRKGKAGRAIDGVNYDEMPGRADRPMPTRPRRLRLAAEVEHASGMPLPAN